MTDDQIRLICATAIRCATILGKALKTEWGTAPTDTLTQAIADVSSMDHTLKSTRK